MKSMTQSRMYLEPWVCGNGVLEEGEECDDGNWDYGDGCDDFCIVECGYECEGPNCYTVCGDMIKAGSESCDSTIGCAEYCLPLPEFDCEKDSNICHPEGEVYCGDGLVTGEEECDDMNNENGDCCNEFCKLECGFYWHDEHRCDTFCGDGIIAGDEECDGGEDCTSQCTSVSYTHLTLPTIYSV